jgi:hypothetical protein
MHEEFRDGRRFEIRAGEAIVASGTLVARRTAS